MLEYTKKFSDFTAVPLKSQVLFGFGTESEQIIARIRKDRITDVLAKTKQHFAHNVGGRQIRNTQKLMSIIKNHENLSGYKYIKKVMAQEEKQAEKLRAKRGTLFTPALTSSMVSSTFFTIHIEYRLVLI